MTAWHPVFLTDEPEPGRWSMTMPGTVDGPFGWIELRRTNGGPRYKVTLGDDHIGWAATFRVACETLWVAYVDRGEVRRRQAHMRHPP